MADLFAFARRARVVSDGNFGNLLTHAAEFGGDFGTELKALAFEVNLRDQRAAEDFIASGLVVDARAVKQISQMSQKLCTEEKSKSALGAIWTHAVNYICLTLFERTQQSGIVLRIVFKIGVLNQDIFSAGVLERGPDGRAFAAVLLM